jgi:hypothetical protein
VTSAVASGVLSWAVDGKTVIQAISANRTIIPVKIGFLGINHLKNAARFADYDFAMLKSIVGKCNMIYNT